MFPDLQKFTDPEKLRKLAANARRLGHQEYALQCQIRIAELAGLSYDDDLEREFWTAVTIAEELKTAENGKTTRLSRTRQKHKRVGAKQCLTDWALDPGFTDGFRVLVSNGRADMTGEAIVVRHASKFPPEAVASAQLKLDSVGTE